MPLLGQKVLHFASKSLVLVVLMVFGVAFCLRGLGRPQLFYVASVQLVFTVENCLDI
jgi:hypothetical protein